MTKICSTCKNEKDVSEYHKSSKHKDGLRYSCKICVRLENLKYYYKYKDTPEYKIKRRKWHENSIPTIRARKKYRMKHDMSYKLREILSRRIHHVVKEHGKSKSTMELIGCSIEELKTYLQQTAINNSYLDFDINNYSGLEYHIDHIIPCASFDLSKEEEQLKCFNYSNLQILKAIENLQKSDKIL